MVTASRCTGLSPSSSEDGLSKDRRLLEGQLGSAVICRPSYRLGVRPPPRAGHRPRGLRDDQFEGAVGGREPGHLDVDQARRRAALPDVVLVQLLPPLGPHGPQCRPRVGSIRQGRDAGPGRRPRPAPRSRRRRARPVSDRRPAARSAKAGSLQKSSRRGRGPTTRRAVLDPELVEQAGRVGDAVGPTGRLGLATRRGPAPSGQSSRSPSGPGSMRVMALNGTLARTSPRKIELVGLRRTLALPDGLRRKRTVPCLPAHRLTGAARGGRRRR